MQEGHVKDIIQALKESNCQSRLVYPAKLSVLIEGEIITFHNKEKLKEFVTNKPALQKVLKRNWKKQASLTINTEYKLPKCPNQKT
jgi:hypothetical protein